MNYSRLGFKKLFCNVSCYQLYVFNKLEGGIQIAFEVFMMHLYVIWAYNSERIQRIEKYCSNRNSSIPRP